MNRKLQEVQQICEEFFSGREATVAEVTRFLNTSLIKEWSTKLKVKLSGFTVNRQEHITPNNRSPEDIKRAFKKAAVTRKKKALTPLNGRELVREMQQFTLRYLLRNGTSIRGDVERAWNKNHREVKAKQWSGIFWYFKQKGFLKNNGIRSIKCKWRITAKGKKMLEEMKAAEKVAATG